jgi:hypothetical protein
VVCNAGDHAKATAKFYYRQGRIKITPDKSSFSRFVRLRPELAGEHVRERTHSEPTIIQSHSVGILLQSSGR